jgi:pimeloyl-ACP methyl ester carboxylesterase
MSDSLTPFVREVGIGQAVVCIHANGSASSQWRGLMDQMSKEFRVIAPDCWNSGRSPRWELNRDMCLDDEIDLLDHVVLAAGDSFDLVGHSYGAALALKIALRHSARVRALALYEPTLFSVVDQANPPPNGVDGIRKTVNAARAALESGSMEAAARLFADYWIGPSAWESMPPERRQLAADSMPYARRSWDALFNDPTPIHSFAALQMPVLYMLGERSPEAAHAVARELLGVLPRATCVRFPRLGHMAPVTHPELVNAEIARFLRAV